MGVFKAILSAFFGGIFKSIITIALIATAAWGLLQYKLYRDASEQLAQYKSQVEQLEKEGERKDKRLVHLADSMTDREQRKEAWKVEALKWKNRMAELIEENEDVAEWADNLYRAPD